MHLKKMAALAALSVGLVAAGPASAQGGHGHGHGAHGQKVPSRVAQPIKRAERALDRASGYADDGNDASAITALTAVNKNLARAEKAAKRRVANGATTGPVSASAVARAEDDVVAGSSDMFDGASDSLVTALNGTLNAGIDDRDDLVAAIGALSTDDQQDYVDVLSQIDSDVSDEIDGIDESLSDDTLTSEAQDDLTAAKTKLQATQTAVQALLANLDTSSSDVSDSQAAGDGDCPGHNGDSSSSSSSDSSSTADAQARRGARA
jgi:hypothetical protein